MSRKDWPRLGEWVRFTRYYDRPTQEEIEARSAELEGDVGTITLQRRENLAPDVRAVVIGKCAAVFETEVGYNDDSGQSYAWFREGTTHKTFYVLKQTFRGRRFLALAEDMVRQTASVSEVAGRFAQDRMIAVAILDRWLYHMDNPETTPPLEIHHADIAAIRRALGQLACMPNDVHDKPLLAAAPDLLEALELLYKLHAEGAFHLADRHYRAITMTAAAIAKATGS